MPEHAAHEFICPSAGWYFNLYKFPQFGCSGRDLQQMQIHPTPLKCSPFTPAEDQVHVFWNFKELLSARFSHGRGSLHRLGG